MASQKISRKDLFTIYSQVCQNWQTKIGEILVEQQINDKIEISEELILKGFNEANKEQKELLSKYFKIIEKKKITDRVKNFDDILDIAGKSLEEVIPYKNAKTKQQKSQNAYAKIQLIEEILNGGWEPDFSNSNEYKYYPYFEYKSSSGWVYCDFCVCSYSSIAQAGYFKTSELAVFAGKTFLKEYKEFLDRY